VCDKDWLRAMGDSVFMVGVMLGSTIFGALSDKYGRRPIFFLSLVIQLIGGVVVAVTPEFISFVIFRAIVGSTTSGVFLVAYVIGKYLITTNKFYLLSNILISLIICLSNFICSRISSFTITMLKICL
jgi:OCT family organic cation transporter-like MFS transporter 4/5